MKEMLANRPAVGETGENLCRLLCSLREASVQGDLCKRTVEIVNASRIPHYAGAADGKHIKTKEVETNIKFAMARFARKEISHILFFGKETKVLFDKAKYLSNKTCFLCPHLSRQGLADGQGCYKWPIAENNTTISQMRLEIIEKFIAQNWNRPGQHVFPIAKRRKT